MREQVIRSRVKVIQCGFGMTVNDLKQFIDRTVTLRMSDGEIVKVKVSLVDDEDEEIVVAVIESSHSERYRGPCAMHTFAAREIVSVEELHV